MVYEPLVWMSNAMKATKGANSTKPPTATAQPQATAFSLETAATQQAKHVNANPMSQQVD